MCVEKLRSCLLILFYSLYCLKMIFRHDTESILSHVQCVLLCFLMLERTWRRTRQRWRQDLPIWLLWESTQKVITLTLINIVTDSGHFLCCSFVLSIIELPLLKEHSEGKCSGAVWCSSYRFSCVSVVFGQVLIWMPSVLDLNLLRGNASSLPLLRSWKLRRSKTCGSDISVAFHVS